MLMGLGTWTESVMDNPNTVPQMGPTSSKIDSRDAVLLLNSKKRPGRQLQFSRPERLEVKAAKIFSEHLLAFFLPSSLPWVLQGWDGSVACGWAGANR